eukprot:TRINITY_DN4774_c0_g1_i1.p1 TRINITY_DN4774_c0_g1~~TRINITY_DN4774_c0_g1_i1.p1  ORF type:complete len:706 (+),score=104.09 TRINITY_DN4774_c0_g1_i1:378-2495(+)
MSLSKGQQHFYSRQFQKGRQQPQNPLIVIQVSNQEEWESWIQELKRQICREVEQMIRWSLRLTIVTCGIIGTLHTFKLLRKLRRRRMKRLLEQLKPSSLAPAAIRQHESPEVPLYVGIAPQWSLLDVSQLTADTHPGFEVFCTVFNTYRVQDLFMFIVQLKNVKYNVGGKNEDFWEEAQPWTEDVTQEPLAIEDAANVPNENGQDVTNVGNEGVCVKDDVTEEPLDVQDAVNVSNVDAQYAEDVANVEAEVKNEKTVVATNGDDFIIPQDLTSEENKHEDDTQEVQIAGPSNAAPATEKLVFEENFVEVPLEDAVKKFSLAIHSGELKLRKRRWGISRFPSEYRVDASDDLIDYLRTLAVVVLQDEEFEQYLDSIQPIDTPRNSLEGQSSKKRIQFNEMVEVQEIEMVQPEKPKRKPKRIGDVCLPECEIMEACNGIHDEVPESTREKQISFIQQIKQCPTKFKYGKNNSFARNSQRAHKRRHGVCEVCSDKYNLQEMVFCSGGHGVCIPCLRQYTLLTHGLRAGGAVVRCVVMEAQHKGLGTLRRCEGSYPSKVLQQCLKPTEYLQLQMFDYLRDIRVATLDAVSFRCKQCRSTGVIPLVLLEPGGMLGCINAGCTAFYCTRCGKQCTRLEHLCSADPHDSPLLHWATLNRKQVRNCPNCGLIIEKTGGCHHMICPSSQGGCGYEFCWRCTARWTVAHYLCGSS